MNEYKFIPTPVFRDPILRYWIFLKGKILPIGYPAKDSTPNPHHNERYELSHTVFYNKF